MCPCGVLASLELSDEIERLQQHALRFIAYPSIQSYVQQLTHFDVQLLSERRNELLLRFGLGLLKSERHPGILPYTRQSVSRHNIQLRILTFLRVRLKGTKIRQFLFLTKMLNFVM